MAEKVLSSVVSSKLFWWHRKARWPTNASHEVLNGLTMGIFHCDFPITANAAGPGSWEMPVALTWQTRGIRKMDGRPAGAWESRGESPPALVCVWFSEPSKQVFIPGSQAPCLSTCALGQNLSESAQARLHLCSGNQDSVPPFPF